MLVVLRLDVNLSNWMAVTIFSGALSISSIKRERIISLWIQSQEVLKYYKQNLRIITI